MIYITYHIGKTCPGKGKQTPAYRNLQIHHSPNFWGNGIYKHLKINTVFLNDKRTHYLQLVQNTVLRVTQHGDHSSETENSLILKCKNTLINHFF
jgi:hypothetical protein